MQEMQVQSLAQEDPLEEGMAPHSSILACKSHGQRSLSGYSPWGRKRVRQDRVTEQQQEKNKVMNISGQIRPHEYATENYFMGLWPLEANQVMRMPLLWGRNLCGACICHLYKVEALNVHTEDMWLAGFNKDDHREWRGSCQQTSTEKLKASPFHLQTNFCILKYKL